MTYAKQYATAVERFVAQKIYDAGWMLMTWVNNDGTIGYDEPIPTATAVTLATQIDVARSSPAKPSARRQKRDTASPCSNNTPL